MKKRVCSFLLVLTLVIVQMQGIAFAAEASGDGAAAHPRSTLATPCIGVALLCDCEGLRAALDLDCAALRVEEGIQPSAD